MPLKIGDSVIIIKKKEVLQSVGHYSGKIYEILEIEYDQVYPYVLNTGLFKTCYNKDELVLVNKITKELFLEE